MSWRQHKLVKTGLMYHDILNDDHEDVQEALRRLPKREQDERQYRVTRALYLSMRHEVLPKDQWTSVDSDSYYLRPYLEEVRREIKERDEWNKL